MADFTLAFQKTLKHEGGYQNDPLDHGNWYEGVNYGTKYGVTMADCVAYLQADPNDHSFVKNLTPDQAATCYKAGYWKDLYSQIASQPLAEKLFDMGVLFGVGTAVKLLQISMESEINIVSDGVFGPQTLADANQYGDPSAYRTVLLNHCMDVVNRNPSDAEFLNGWITRINS